MFSFFKNTFIFISQSSFNIMTAEIVIMSRRAVVMAADSVVTLSTQDGKQKTYPNANKLFSLSYNHAIGIMTYGAADFLGVPWETIIKIYREEADRLTFNTLMDCGNHFIRFLEKSNLFPQDIQNHFAYYHFEQFHFSIRKKILDDAKSVFDNSENSQDVNPISIVLNVFDFVKKNLSACPALKLSNHKSFMRSSKAELENIEKNVYEELFDEFKDDIKIISDLYFKHIVILNSGIVISGFGEKEHFPSTISLNIYEMRKNNLIYTMGCTSEGCIMPFAQREGADLFMKDIDPFCYDEIKKIIHKHAPAESENIITEIDSHIQEISSPRVDILDSFPIADLAFVAENLVSLTSFKRRFTIDVETVGGPIDVAVISKGDGFIWIKRKHYFDPELNPHFISKYSKK